MTINEHGTVLKIGQLSVAGYSLPSSLLSRTDLGVHNTTEDLFKFIGFMDGEKICRICHSECKYGCVGVTDSDCIAPTGFLDEEDNGCKNVQFGVGKSGRCIPECPEKYFSKENYELSTGTLVQGSATSLYFSFVYLKITPH